MSAIKANPFHKPNPFKYSNVQRFHHAHLPSSETINNSYMTSSNTYRLKQSNISGDSWQFNQNNMNRRIDFTRKYEPSSSQVSDFEMRMKVSSLYTAPNNRPKISQYREQKLENPFFRKNLLVSKAEVQNQLQIDVNMYRNKASSYHVSGGRMSFGNNQPIQSRYILNQPEGILNLVQPQTNKQLKKPQLEQTNPVLIEFRSKKFYLNNVAPDSPPF